MAESSQQKERIKPNNIVKNKRFDTTHHNLQKRASQKNDIRESVLYVSSKSNIKGLLEKCDKLVKKDEKEIIINCMGAAIQRGILLALQVCERHVAYQLSTNTSTVELIDDLEPTIDEADYEILRRNNSALQIKVFRADTTIS